MIDNKFIDGLFKNEYEKLQSARNDISDERYHNNELLPKYAQLTSDYGKLLTLTSKIFKISDTQGRDLKRRENEIKNLLDNSSQGFLTFGADLLVDREYSQECTRIFNKKIANCSIIELLSGPNTVQNELFADVFKEVFQTNDMDSRLSYLEKLPGVISVNNIYISIKYRIISHSEFETTEDMIMLILTDITEKRKAEDQVLYLSYHDKLTSLYNRAYVDSILPQLNTSASFPLSVIMADMNGLKLTNDVFGHETGDKLLASLANIFTSCCRKSDIIARWGGDEFLIILPGADQTVSERICGRIKKACSEVVPEPIELSVSLGAATMENSSASLSELFGIAENMMYSNKLVESKGVRKKIILNLEKSLHSKSYEDFEHVKRVKTLAMHFAKCLGLDSESLDMANLPLLASLHDIGKVAIPKEILCKRGPLTDNEWKIIKSHSEIGFRMAQSIEEPILAQAILSMRERWDGKGYPYGLKGEQIPLVTRIISIIDAYDVMTHDRPYKEKLSAEEAIIELKRCSGSQFDPSLIEVFLGNIANSPAI